MSTLLSLPPWLPWWVPLAVAVPVLLWGLVFVLMPFGVFGLRSRLDGVEARLDEIQGEIRNLALRLPEPGREEFYEPPPRRGARQAGRRRSPQRRFRQPGPRRVRSAGGRSRPNRAALGLPAGPSVRSRAWIGHVEGRLGR